MTCATDHAPSVSALSVGVTALNGGAQSFCTPTQPCPTEDLKQHGVEAVENSVLCDVMCCCKDMIGTGARQNCVRETLDAADEALGHYSRYKAEVSYNMTTEPPSPFMHRGGTGMQKSGNWQYRARNEIEGYAAGKGMVRRPDIVIVRDPTHPPTADNIERVVEMKFRNDPYPEEQRDAYAKITGEEADLMTEDQCGCAERERERQRSPQDSPYAPPIPFPAAEDGDDLIPEPIPVPVDPVPPPQDDGIDWSAMGRWALVGAAGVGVVAAVLFPFDGPALDIAASAAFAAALGNAQGTSRDPTDGI